MQLKGPFENISLFLLIKLIGNIIAVAIVRNLFYGAKGMPDKQRRMYLIVTTICIAFSIFGCFRNSFTLWKYQSFSSYFFLSFDIAQLLYFFALYLFVYMRDVLSVGITRLLVALSLVFLGLNFYSFVVNFHYLKEEGVLVFIFWFANNFYLGCTQAANAYLSLFKRNFLSGKKIK